MTSRLDGNAIAGILRDVFGEEMTTAAGTCAHCGFTGPLGELTVYLQAPGVVARCSRCEQVMLVVVEIRGFSCVDLMGMAALERP
jgi:uncharacterized protein DUF6510